MLMIKLSKTGKTNKKMFRLVISEKSRDPFGKMLEILGSYNPYTKDLQVKSDRVKHWISQGAQMTPTVNNLLVGKNVVEGKKVSASKVGKKSEKRLSQLKAKADKKSEPVTEIAAEEPKEAINSDSEEVKKEVEEVAQVETETTS